MRRREQRRPIFEGRREAYALRRRLEELLEEASPLHERQVDDRLSVDGEDVEDHEHEVAGTRLERFEAGRPRLVERAHLAVEHRRRRADGMDDGAGNRAEALGQVVAVSARQRRLAPADRHDRPVSVPLRLEQPARTARQDIGDRRELRARRDGSLGRRVLPQEEPVPLVPVEVRGDERPDAVDPLPPEPEGEAAVGLLLQELVRPAVPDLDRAGAVLAGRDRALEGAVVEWMILDVDREVPLAGREGQPLRHGPAGEGAVPLESQIVVEPPCVVALDDEDRAAARRASAERLGCAPRVALAPVVAERGHVPDHPTPVALLTLPLQDRQNPCSPGIRNRG